MSFRSRTGLLDTGPVRAVASALERVVGVLKRAAGVLKTHVETWPTRYVEQRVEAFEERK